MANTDIQVDTLIINELTKSEFEEITPSNTELYFITDEGTNNSGSGRNVGDVFYTTRTDTEINGAVECNGATYNTTDFTGSASVGDLLRDGKLPYVSLSEYASVVSTNGSCRSFGWNGEESFRVPTLQNVYIEAGTATSASEFISESLPNITGSFTNNGNSRDGSSVSGAFSIKTKTGLSSNGNTASTGGEYDFNASRSSSAYQDGAKVKPDSVRYRAMVQLANSATDEALITATSALQQIANKAESDLSNVSENIDYVVESYNDGTDWYRVYKSGWCEQGGVISTANKTAVTLTFLKEMRDTNYTFFVTQKDGTEVDFSNGFNTKSYTTTNLIIMNRTGGTCHTNWVLYGYVA